jgi:hypothetical protein
VVLHCIFQYLIGALISTYTSPPFAAVPFGYANTRTDFSDHAQTSSCFDRTFGFVVLICTVESPRISYILYRIMIRYYPGVALISVWTACFNDRLLCSSQAFLDTSSRQWLRRHQAVVCL